MDTTRQKRRGVSWVLRQAAVVGVLALLGVHVSGVYCLALAQRQLSSAAERAVEEARLPQASLRSIEDRARNMLDADATATVRVTVFRNARTKRTTSGIRPGDRVVVQIAAPARPMLPTHLARLAPWLACEEMLAEAKAVVP